MSRSIATKRLGYEALRRLDNLRYRARRDFVISRRRRSDLNDSPENSHVVTNLFVSELTRLNLLEAAAGIEPAYKGFAGLGLPTWLRRPKTLSRQKAKPAISLESDSGFQ